MTTDLHGTGVRRRALYRAAPFDPNLGGIFGTHNVYFVNGSVGFDYKPSGFYVRAVRGGL